MNMFREPISRVRIALALLVASVALALQACGDDASAPPTDLQTRTTPVAAYSFPAQEPWDTGEYCSETDGLEFVPWVDIEVTSLGYYDDDGDGLVREHTVGIFETSSTELVTPAVTVDDESTLQDGFRYEAVDPVILKGGSSYVLAGSTTAPYDLYVQKPDDLAWAPELRYVTYCVVVGSEFAFPWRSRQVHLETDLFAANFTFRSPSSVAPAATP